MALTVDTVYASLNMSGTITASGLNTPDGKIGRNVWITEYPIKYQGTSLPELSTYVNGQTARWLQKFTRLNGYDANDSRCRTMSEVDYDDDGYASAGVSYTIASLHTYRDSRTVNGVSAGVYRVWRMTKVANSSTSPVWTYTYNQYPTYLYLHQICVKLNVNVDYSSESAVAAALAANVTNVDGKRYTASWLSTSDQGSTMQAWANANRFPTASEIAQISTVNSFLYPRTFWTDNVSEQWGRLNISGNNNTYTNDISEVEEPSDSYESLDSYVNGVQARPYTIDCTNLVGTEYGNASWQALNLFLSSSCDFGYTDAPQGKTYAFLGSGNIYDFSSDGSGDEDGEQQMAHFIMFSSCRADNSNSAPVSCVFGVKQGDTYNGAWEVYSYNRVADSRTA